MPVQVNIFLLLFGGLQAVLLAILLFKKGKSLPGYFFLTAYLIILTLQILLKVMSKLWLMESLGLLYSFSYQLPFLYGPLIYLFIRETTDPGKTGRKDLLHFLPSLLVLAFLVLDHRGQNTPFFLEPFFRRRWSMELQLASLLIYHGLAFRSLLQFQQGHTYPSPGIITMRVAWLRRFVFISWLVCSVIAVVICLMYLWFPFYQQMRFGFVALTGFIYWISYKALSQPEIFGVIKGYARGEADFQNPVVSMLTVHHPAKKYSNSGLRGEELDTIVLSTDAVMKKDQLYLRPELTIDELASAAGFSRHHLSQALNEKLGKSFYDYTNHYRVEEAKSLLKDPGRIAYKIAAVAFDAGFNSISTFNEVFKKSTGQTPSQFRKQQEEKRFRKQRV